MCVVRGILDHLRGLEGEDGRDSTSGDNRHALRICRITAEEQTGKSKDGKG